MGWPVFLGRLFYCFFSNIATTTISQTSPSKKKKQKSILPYMYVNVVNFLSTKKRVVACK